MNKDYIYTVGRCVQWTFRLTSVSHERLLPNVFCIPKFDFHSKVDIIL